MIGVTLGKETSAKNQSLNSMEDMIVQIKEEDYSCYEEEIDLGWHLMDNSTVAAE